MNKTPISPKVTSGAAVAAIVGLVLQVAALITPDMFSGLGKWAAPAYLLVTLAAGALAAYWKKDPLRAPAAAATVISLPPASAPTSFAPTQARLDAAAAAEVPAAPIEPVTVTPVYEPPAAPEAPPAP